MQVASLERLRKHVERLGPSALDWSTRLFEDVDNSYDRDGYTFEREQWFSYTIVAAFFPTDQEITSLSLGSVDADQLRTAIRDELAIWDEDAWKSFDDCAMNYRTKQPLMQDRSDRGDVLGMWVLARASPAIPTSPEGLRLPRLLGRHILHFGSSFWRAAGDR